MVRILKNLDVSLHDAYGAGWLTRGEWDTQSYWSRVQLSHYAIKVNIQTTRCSALSACLSLTKRSSHK